MTVHAMLRMAIVLVVVLADASVVAGIVVTQAATRNRTESGPDPVETRSSDSPVSADQCAALCDLYKATTAGDGWIHTCQDGWAAGCKTTAPADCCKWHGIQCNGGSVSSISLGGCNLQGGFGSPSVFSLLPDLDTFTVNNGGEKATCSSPGGLSGALPADISKATNLRVLGAYCNSLSGGLSAIASLPKLEQVDFHDNSLGGSLPGFSNCASTLNYVSVANNQMSGPIPRSWESLSRLTTMGLAHNGFSGSIDWLVNSEVLPGMCVLYRGAHPPAILRARSLPNRLFSPLKRSAFVSFGTANS
jgi:hypothetical protein